MKHIKLFEEYNSGYKYNEEELLKCVNNYLLTVYDNISILKINKFKYSRQHNYKLAEVTVKYIKIDTEQIVSDKISFIAYDEDFAKFNGAEDVVVAYNMGFDRKGRKTVEELLGMDLIPNNTVDSSLLDKDKQKEILAKQKADNAEYNKNYKHSQLIKKLQSDINYNIKQRRTPKAAKRSYTKYSIEDLYSYFEELTEEQRDYLQLVIDEIEKDELPKETVSQKISKYRGVEKFFLLELEKTFETDAKKVYDSCLSDLIKKYEKYPSVNIERLETEAEYFVEVQKFKLFRAVFNIVDDLNIVKVVKLRFINHPNGFQGTWEFTLEDGSTKLFSTKSIIASGSIQRMHYRYLSNIS
jgi:hypothetical protein